MNVHLGFVALVALMLAFPAQALTPQQERMQSCNGKANEKSLKGDERKGFMSQCLSGKTDATDATLTPQQQKMKQCNADASAQNLKGSARKTFMKECLSK